MAEFDAVLLRTRLDLLAAKAYLLSAGAAWLDVPRQAESIADELARLAASITSDDPNVGITGTSRTVVSSP